MYWDRKRETDKEREKGRREKKRGERTARSGFRWLCAGMCKRARSRRGWEFGLPRVPTPSYCTTILTLLPERPTAVRRRPRDGWGGGRERERESGRPSERGHCVSFQSVSFGNTYRVSPQDSADGLRLGNLFRLREFVRVVSSLSKLFYRSFSSLTRWENVDKIILTFCIVIFLIFRF